MALWQRRAGATTLGPRLRWTLVAAIAAFAVGIAPWAFIRLNAADAVQHVDQDIAPAEAIIVLGTLVQRDGEPSPRLVERLDTTIELFEDSAAPLVLMSGTGLSDADNNEPQVMAEYVVARGIPADAVLEDPAGFDTLATCVNARDEFGFDRIILVTNEFHTYRAAWLCEQTGMEAVAVHDKADTSFTYFRKSGREIAAAWKAVLEVADIWGNVAVDPGDAPE